MLNALFTDWVEYIDKPASFENIKKSLRKIKIYFLVFFVVSLFIMFFGLVMILASNNIKIQLEGLLVAIIGFGSNCLMKIWTHIQLAKYKILWEMNKRFETNIEHELRRSEAQDL